MLTCKIGDKTINCYDGTYSKETLKKWADKNILLCHACGKPYEYCHGRIVQPYFRHKEKEQCEDKYSEPETEEHINGKKALYKWVKTLDKVSDVILEGWIPETHQRPDIMFKYDGKQYVIEFQCTPISSEYLERHELYQAAGIIDIWILGTKNYMNTINQLEIKNRRTKTIEEYTNLYFDVYNGLMLFSNYTLPNDNIFIFCFNYNDSISFLNKYGISKTNDKDTLFVVSLKDVLIINDDIYITNTVFNNYIEKYNDIIKKNEDYLFGLCSSSGISFNIEKSLHSNEYIINFSFENDEFDFKLNYYYNFIDNYWYSNKIKNIDIRNILQPKIDSIVNLLNYSKLIKYSLDDGDYYYSVIFCYKHKDLDKNKLHYFSISYDIIINYTESEVMDIIYQDVNNTYKNFIEENYPLGCEIRDYFRRKNIE